MNLKGCMEIIIYKGDLYPAFQATGNAARFCLPFAKEVCKGAGYDIGCNREEWMLPGATPIDISLSTVWDAYNLPGDNVDFVFSSHCLEHLPNWVDALDYWRTVLKMGGILFLYLPHYSQQHWRPWNNRKHTHVLQPEIIKDYLQDNGWNKIFISGADLNNSFTVIAHKTAI